MINTIILVQQNPVIKNSWFFNVGNNGNTFLSNEDGKLMLDDLLKIVNKYNKKLKKNETK